MVNVRETSLEAYLTVKLGERQKEVLKIFQDNPARDYTDKQLAYLLNWTINRVTPRRGELADMKRIKFSKFITQNNGRRAMAWILNQK